MIVFLKAVVKKQVWIAGYTNKAGTYVRPHQTTVNADPSHDDAKVAAGQGKEYEKKAHAHLSKQEGHNDLPIEQQSNHILHLATAMQKEASATSDINTLKNKIIAGKKPTPGEWKSLLSATDEKRQDIVDQIKAAGKFDFYSDLAAEHAKKQGDQKDSGKEEKPDPVKKPLNKKVTVTKESDKKSEHELNKDQAKTEDEDPVKKESPRHAAALSEMASLPDGNYKKQAHSELSAYPEWDSWGDKEKHDKVMALYKQKQNAANATSNITKFKKTVKAGGIPTTAQMSAVMALPDDKRGELLSQMAEDVGGTDKLKEILAQADKKAKAQGVTYGKAEASPVESEKKDDEGPNEGDTKEGADGTLIFKDGRWHKQKESLDDILSQSTKVAEAAQDEKDAADWKPSIDEVMALMSLPKPQQKAKLTEFADKMGGVDKLSAVLADYGKQASAAAEKPVKEKAPKKEPEPAKDYKDGDALDNSELAKIPPGTVIQLYSEGKPWKQALVGRNSVWLSKSKGEGYYKEPLSLGNLSSFYYGGYSDDKPMIVSIGNEEWMSEAQSSVINNLVSVKADKDKPANVYMLNSKLVVVGDASDPDSLFWVDDAGKFGAGFTAGQKKALADGKYKLIGDNSEAGKNPVPDQTDIESSTPGISEPKAAGDNAWEIKPFSHSKTGVQLHSVPVPVKLSADDYKLVAAMAKENNGYWSKYDKDGAVKGFLFKTDEDAQAFSAQAGEFMASKEGGDSGSEKVAKEESAKDAAGDIPTKVSNGLEYLAGSDGWVKQYTNLTQAHASAKKLQDKGYDVHVTAQHPFKIVIDGKPADSDKSSPLDNIGNVGSASGAEWIAASYIDGENNSPESVKLAVNALEKNGYSAIAKKITEKYSDQAPVGTSATFNAVDYKKIDGGWLNTKNEKEMPNDKDISAVLEILSGHKPAAEWFEGNDDESKQYMVDIVTENGVSKEDALKAIFPNGQDGPNEGDTKVVGGVTYVLKDGRWHKVGDDDKSGKSGSLAEALDAVPLPDLSNTTPGNIAAINNALNTLKQNVITDGHSAFTGVVKKSKAKGTLHFNIKGDYSTGAKGLKCKAYVDFDENGNPVPGNNSGEVSKALVNANNYIDALKAAHEEFSGKKPKKKSVKKSTPVAGSEPSTPEVISAGITKIDGWEKVGEQKGSNPGGAFKDKSGKQWYCKFPSNPDAVKNELLAAKFYQMMGVSVPNLKLVEKDGQLGIASKWVDDMKVGSASELAKADGTHDAFAIDAWLGNWDVVGLSNDNLMLDKDGKAVRIDVGGSLLYRAMGGEKGAAFGDEVTELKTLIDPSKNSQSASVFGDMSPEALKASAKKVAKIKPAQIRKMVEMFGPGDSEAKKALAEKLIARRQSILSQVEVRDPWVANKIDDENLNVNAEDLPEIHDFANWNGQGKGLSSSKYYNDLNHDTEQEIYDLAKKGNLKALKAYQYTEVDKNTGNVLGKKSIENHPSVHVQGFWSECVSSLDQLAHPSIESYDLPGVGGDVSEISDGAGFFKFGDSIDSVSAEKRFGFWMKLSHAIDIDDIVPPAVTHTIESIKSQGQSWYSKVSSITKHMISGIQGSGTYNNAFRDGKKTTYDGESTVKMTANAYADALEMPEGTEIYKWVNIPDAMQKMFNNAEKGLILQNPGSMCCSVHPENTQHFGPHRMKIRYAKGAKALNSFGSGSFKSEEEITTLPGARFVVLSVKKGNPKSGTGLDIELMMLPPAGGYLEALASEVSMIKSFLTVFFAKNGNKNEVDLCQK